MPCPAQGQGQARLADHWKGTHLPCAALGARRGPRALAGAPLAWPRGWEGERRRRGRRRHRHRPGRAALGACLAPPGPPRPGVGPFFVPPALGPLPKSPLFGEV